MKTLKLIAIAIVAGLALAPACGTDGGGGGGTGGNPIIGAGGAGGGSGGHGGTPVPDAAVDFAGANPLDVGLVPELPPLPTDTPVTVDLAGGEAGQARTLVNCTGLTADQCHHLIINPSVPVDGVLAQDPGADPVVPYPSCTAM
jgi:hypothetical protein